MSNTSQDFEVIVGPVDGVIESADVPIRWCVTPSLIKKLEEDDVKYPYVLISTFDQYGNNEWRTIVPLEDTIAYARFHKAGKMQLFVSIIGIGLTSTSSRKEAKKHVNMYMHKEYYDYSITLQYRGYVHPANIENHNLIYANSLLQVTIPDGVFAPEPSEKIKWFVNLFHSTKVEDQCSFRKRMILAFTIKWIPVLMWIIFYPMFVITMSLLLYLFGYNEKIPSNILQQILHPFTYAEQSYVPDIIDSKHIIKKEWSSGKQIIWSLFLFSPGVLLSVLGIVYIIPIISYATTFEVIMSMGVVYLYVFLSDFINYIMWKYEMVDNNSMSYLVSALLIVLILALSIKSTITIVSLAVLMFGCYNIINWFNNKSTKDYKYSEMREILCPDDVNNLSTDISSIPKENRTIHLKFTNFKAKICKPMQH